tara:strand:- start:1286 stop:1951 length:666 start_codon:yes stop_codon:yes gene_type:complete
MSNICNICLEETQYFVKICECNESRICTDCLVGLNFHNLHKCPLCRRQLKLETIINNKLRFKILLSYFLRFFTIITIQFIIPILYFSSSSPNDNIIFDDNIIHWVSKDKNIIGLISSAVFIVQPLNIILYGFVNRIELENCINFQNNIIKVVCILNGFIETLLFISNINTVAWYYFMFILVPFYYSICGTYIMIIIIEYLKYYLKEVRSNISNTRIVPIQQ